MSTHTKIFSDGERLFLTLSIKQKNWVIVLVVLALVLVFTSIFLGLYFSRSPRLMNGIFFGALFIIFALGLLHKEILWKLKGREYMIISTKDIQYQYDYGIAISTVKTLQVEHVKATFTKKKKDKNRIELVEKKRTSLVKDRMIYLTKLSAKESDVALINEKLDEIYFNEFYSTYEFNRISLN